MLMQIVPQRVPDSYVRSTVTLRTQERIQSLSQQILSRTQLEQLIQEFNLYPEERARLPLQDVVERVQASIAVEIETSVRGTRASDTPDAFHVRFTYRDPATAARVTQRLGSLFADFNARDRGTLADATNDFLQAQLADARARLEAQEQKREQFRRKNAGKLPSQLEFNLQAIQSTQLELQALVESLARDRDRKLILERLYSDAQAAPAPVAPAPATTAAPDSAAAPATASPAQQLEVARAVLARMELRLTPEHPDVIRTKRLIEDLQKKVDADAAAQAASGGTGSAAPAMTREEQARRERLTGMRAELESLGRQIAFKESEDKRLRDKIADYQRRIEAVPGIESEWLVLTRDYDTLQEAYRDLLTKSESSRVAADLERRQIGEQFRVLDPARVPVTPIDRQRVRTNGIGVAVGLFLGLGLAALLELRDTSFRTQADVLDVLALPVLALIPLIETAADRKRAWRRRLIVSSAVVLAGAAAGYVVWSMKLWNYIV
jgi:polysaccharide chain length determinant protein (PEP-CTERM system associated)